MMNPSEIYAQFNLMQRKDSTSIMKEYSSSMNWTDDENVLDVGCGPGDVTVDLILPLLSENSKLTGTDINPNMIEYATKTYTDKRLKFVTADFGCERITDILHENSFNKIFSFYCLHWIKDQKQVAFNLSSLLRSGGEVLAVIMVNTTAFHVYETLSKMDKWKTYMQDVNKFISPYYKVPNVQQMVHDIFPAAGLVVKACELRECSFKFPSFENQLKSFEAVNPFLPRIPEELKAEYCEALKQAVLLCDEQTLVRHSGCVLPTKYQLLVLHLYKP